MHTHTYVKIDYCITQFVFQQIIVKQEMANATNYTLMNSIHIKYSHVGFVNKICTCTCI